MRHRLKKLSSDLCSRIVPHSFENVATEYRFPILLNAPLAICHPLLLFKHPCRKLCESAILRRDEPLVCTFFAATRRNYYVAAIASDIGQWAYSDAVLNVPSGMFEEIMSTFTPRLRGDCFRIAFEIAFVLNVHNHKVGYGTSDNTQLRAWVFLPPFTDLRFACDACLEFLPRNGWYLVRTNGYYAPSTLVAVPQRCLQQLVLFISFHMRVSKAKTHRFFQAGGKIDARWIFMAP